MVKRRKHIVLSKEMQEYIELLKRNIEITEKAKRARFQLVWVKQKNK